jgi:hypothetical protein
LRFKPEVEDEILSSLAYIKRNDKHYVIGFYEKSIRLWTLAFYYITSSKIENKEFKNYVTHDIYV